MGIKVKTKQLDFSGDFIYMLIFLVLAVVLIGAIIQSGRTCASGRHSASSPSSPLTQPAASAPVSVPVPESNYAVLSRKYPVQYIKGEPQLYVEGERNTVCLKLSEDKPTLSELETFDAMVEILKTDARTWRVPF